MKKKETKKVVAVKKPKAVTSKTFTRKLWIIIDEEHFDDLSEVYRLQGHDFYDTKDEAREDACPSDGIVEVTLTYTLKKHICNCDRCSSKE